MTRNIRRGDVYLANLNNCKTGTVISGLRPVLVIQNDMGNFYSPNVIVCAMTSSAKKPMPTHVEVARGNANLDRDSVVLAESIFTLQKTDLVDYIGTLDNNYLEKVNMAIASSLELIS